MYTSAGVTAGIDLALALIEEDHGPDLARDVARALVVYMQRTGGQSQFTAPLQGPPPRSPALRKITDLVTANPRGDYSLGELAKYLNVSTRHLTRLFHDELSTTPARYVENVRFDMARALLDQGHSDHEFGAGDLRGHRLLRERGGAIRRPKASGHEAPKEPVFAHPRATTSGSPKTAPNYRDGLPRPVLSRTCPQGASPACTPPAGWEGAQR